MREKWHFITAVLTASILAGSMLSQAFAAPMDYTVSVDDENHFIFYDFDEVQVRIPDEWGGQPSCTSGRGESWFLP